MKQIILMLVAGCAVEPVATESVEFTTDDGYSLTTSGSSTLDLGPTAGRVCFLAGFAGTVENFRTMEIDVTGGHYQLVVQSALPIKVYARCVTATGTAEVLRNDFRPTAVIAPMAPGRRCFLTHIEHEAGHVFTTLGDEVDITNDGTNWLLGEHIGGQFKGPPGTIGARCVDGTTSLGAWGLTAGSGASSIPMTSVSGSACGMQIARGIFEDEDTTQGVWISHDQSTGLFTLNATNSHYIQAGCLE